MWKWLAVLHFCWTFTNRHFAQQESMGWSWVYCLLVWLGSWSECMSSLLDKDNMVHKKEVAFSDSNWKQFLERLKPVKTTRSTVKKKKKKRQKKQLKVLLLLFHPLFFMFCSLSSGLFWHHWHVLDITNRTPEALGSTCRSQKKYIHIHSFKFVCFYSIV